MCVIGGVITAWTLSKTKELIWDFRRSRHENPVTINNVNVDISDDYKYLGITVDNQFKFSSHISNCQQK